MQNGEVKVEAVKTSEQMILAAYKEAEKYAGGLIKKYNADAVMSEGDLLNEFITNFIQKGFAEKFDPKVTSLKHYVWTGLRNILVSALRKSNHEPRVSNVVEHEGTETSIFDLIEDNSAAKELIANVYLENVLSQVEEVRFGHGKGEDKGVPFMFDGRVFPSTTKSLVELFFKGFTKNELAEAFKVTPARVGQLLKSALEPVLPARLLANAKRAKVQA